MELEFDKEIDAILRKARSGINVALPASGDSHLDADTIVAFAENALPQKAKLLYMEHLADCNRCRQMLSHSMAFEKEAVGVVAATASSPIGVPEIAETIPWYKSLFRSPNLALVMGALALTFTGLIGFLALRQQSDTANSEVSQISSDSKPVQGGPYYPGDSETATAANSANTSAPAANAPAAAAPNAAATPGLVSANSAANTMASAPDGGLPMMGGVPKTAGDEKELAREEIAKGEAKPAMSAKPESVTAQPPPGSITDRTDMAKSKSEDKDLTLAERRAADDRAGRDAVPSPMKKDTGPSRSRSGPINNQVQMDGNSTLQSTNIYNEGSTRSVGGKTFDRRSGVWYDISYRGQSTTNVRRGTDEYKKLDGGVRNTAENLGGVVVIVWKGKAYRIQ